MKRITSAVAATMGAAFAVTTAATTAQAFSIPSPVPATPHTLGAYQNICGSTAYKLKKTVVTSGSKILVLEAGNHLCAFTADLYSRSGQLGMNSQYTEPNGRHVGGPTITPRKANWVGPIRITAPFGSRAIFIGGLDNNVAVAYVTV